VNGFIQKKEKKKKEREERSEEKEKEKNSACALCIIIHYVAFTSRIVNRYLDISISGRAAGAGTITRLCSSGLIEQVCRSPRRVITIDGRCETPSVGRLQSVDRPPIRGGRRGEARDGVG